MCQYGAPSCPTPTMVLGVILACHIGGPSTSPIKKFNRYGNVDRLGLWTYQYQPTASAFAAKVI